jgi:hypothetical protein
MRSRLGIAAVVSVLWLTGCLFRHKPRTVQNAPPAPQPVSQTGPAVAKPEPLLSIPQTQVELPPPQPVNPAALEVEPQEETPVNAPATMPRPAGPPRISAPKPAEAAVEPAAPAPEPERAPVQEIVPAGELKRLQDSADALKREVRQWLEQTRVRRLDRRERGVMDNVESFLKLSDQAEAKGDMRQAYELAERAWVLAKDLHGGR